MRRLVSFLWLLMALTGGACSAARQGGLNADAVSDLRRERVCWAEREGVFIARGDGSDRVRIFETSKLGEGGVVFHPSMPRAGPDRILFLSLRDLDARDSTGTALTLNILDLNGKRIELWRRVSLSKIVAAGAGGRASIFSVPAVSWSPDGTRIALALRREGQERDGVILMDAQGVPTVFRDVGAARLSRGTSLSWSPEGEALVVGLEDPVGDGAGIIGRLATGPGGDVAATPARPLGRGAYPAVSPDGERIAVVEGREELAVLDRDGALIDRLKIPSGRAPNRLFWSGDGRHLYYYTLIPSGPLGLGQVTVLRCLDTLAGGTIDLVRLR